MRSCARHGSSDQRCALYLRGVALLGVDSVMCPMALRLEAWKRLASDLDRSLLASMTKTIPFNSVIETAATILKGQIRGRVVVEM